MAVLLSSTWGVLMTSALHQLEHYITPLNELVLLIINDTVSVPLAASTVAWWQRDTVWELIRLYIKNMISLLKLGPLRFRQRIGTLQVN